MPSLRRLWNSATVTLLIGCSFPGLPAQVAAAAHPQQRIVDSVNDTDRRKVEGTHSSLVDRATASSHLDPATPLSGIHLVLQPSEQQKAALRALLDDQQDKASPSFHRWLTPDQFGQTFGADPADIAQVRAWLQSQGLTVDSVSRSKRFLTFSGTSGQVEHAFQTQLNALTVDGEQHVANITDITVPAAISAVVRGIARLNDFGPRSYVHGAQKVQLPVHVPLPNFITNSAQPLYGASSTGSHLVAPGDAATIFNTTPLLNAGVDGTGITVAVLARSNISLTDVQAFRTLFGLKKNDPAITVVGSDPGENGDDVEAFLDAEWAGAMAPGANVNFIVGGPSLVSGGIDAAGIYAVDNNIGDIISLSYGGCEKNNGSSYTAFYNDLWEQAAAQGQTVFVSSGDSGAAGCDSSGATYATGGYGVNALGSSAFNVAVGGTMFVDFGPAQYWGSVSATPYASALSYMPEAAWNQGRLSATYLNSNATATVTGSGIVGAGGGIAMYTARPSWQTGNGITTADPVPVTGTGKSTVPSDPGYLYHRLVPDVSLIAASGHDGTLFCAEGFCSISSNGALLNAGVVGGTSVAAPVMASMQALVDQKNGGRQGNANYIYYKLANADFTAGNCQSINGTAGSPTVTLPASTCNFHDVVSGSNIVPTAASGSASIGFSAAPGFDEATGLGSLNAYNLASNWTVPSFTATTTAFSLTPQTVATHGTAMQMAVSVKPSSGSGTPTGDFSVIAETTTPYTVNQFTLSGGAFSGSLNYLPAGTYQVHAHYAGDGVFAPSDSPSLSVTVGKENSITTATSYFVSTSGSSTRQTSFAYGSLIYVDVPVIGASGSGNGSAANGYLPVGTVPSGNVNFSILRNGSALTPLTTTLDTYGDTYLEAASSIANFYLTANYPALSPGSYTVTASYGGDTTFNASSASVSFTVTRLTPTVTFTGPSNIASGSSSTFTYSIATPSSLSSAATGTVTFTDSAGGTLGTATLTNGTATFTTSAITASGAHTITASYAGDTNYASATSTLALTVGSLSSQGITVGSSGTLRVNSTVTLTGTLSSAASGTVRFFDNGIYIGSSTQSINTASYSITYNAFTAGSHTITASYGGNSVYGTASGSAPITIAQYPTSISTSAPGSSTYSQTVAVGATLTFTAASSNIAVQPTGTISVYEGSTLIGSSSTLTYAASYGSRVNSSVNTSGLAPGSHSFSVAYSGDTNFAAVSSTANTVVVAKYTPSITLSSPQTSYGKNATVTLTSTLPLGATLTAPTGAVSFLDGATSLGTASLSYNSSAGGYVASFSTASLTGGTHSITASFAGDSFYNPATSSPLSITVLGNGVWIVNGNHTVSALQTTGSPQNPTATAAGGGAIAIDASGNIWSLNSNGVAEISSTGAIVNSNISAGGITSPAALAIDGQGYIWVANGNNTLSLLDSSGNAVSGTAYTSILNTPSSVSIDGSGNLWITNKGNDTVTEVIGAAAPVTTPTVKAVSNNTLGAKP